MDSLSCLKNKIPFIFVFNRFAIIYPPLVNMNLKSRSNYGNFKRGINTQIISTTEYRHSKNLQR